MIKEFTDKFIAEKELVIEKIKKLLNKDSLDIEYIDLLKIVIAVISHEEDEYSKLTPDIDKIHTIDDGHYEGTFLFVIPATGYQPSDYWYTSVDYGSCSGCDALISAFHSTSVIDDVYILCLHLVQKMKKMDIDDE